MTRFRIVGTHPTNDRDIVDFDVVYLAGKLSANEEFVIYDTQHPVTCKVIDIVAADGVITLRCLLHLGIGWEDQFAGSVVDTESKGGPAGFMYEHKKGPDDLG